MQHLLYEEINYTNVCVLHIYHKSITSYSKIRQSTNITKVLLSYTRLLTALFIKLL